ncbi:MAG TPA: hypothetical protein VKK79_03900 [Candidatus Lokiarchaeia archaeon]|nr:hypothetical protein [Candidatus Lokiarchaeia archaeon]
MSSDLSGLVQDLQKKLKERDTKIKLLDNLIKSAGIKVGGSMEAAMGTATNLKQQIIDLEAENQQLREKVEATGMLSAEGTPSGAVADLVQELQKKLKKKDEEIAKLKSGTGTKGAASRTSGGEDSTALRQKISQLETEITEVRADLAAEKTRSSECEALIDKNSELQSTVEDLQALLGEKAPPVVDSSEIESLSAQNRELQAKVESLQEQLQGFESRDVEVRELQAELAASQAKAQEVESLAAQNQELQATVEKLQAQLGEEQQRSHATREQVFQATVQNLRGELRGTPSEMTQEEGEEATVLEFGAEAGGTGESSDETEIVEGARWLCPKCGNNDRRMIREEQDKTVLINAYPPIYGKKLVCGQCGWTWHHE